MLPLQYPLWPARTLAELTGGQWLGFPPDDADIRGIEVLPKHVEPGDLFVVTSPERWGNKFVNTLGSLRLVKTQAASAVMTDTLPSVLPLNLPVLQVANTRRALTQLAEFARSRLFGKV